jgi:hypothetical protein
MSDKSLQIKGVARGGIAWPVQVVVAIVVELGAIAVVVGAYVAT